MLFGREEHAKLRIKINQENTVIVCNIDPPTQLQYLFTQNIGEIAYLL